MAALRVGELRCTSLELSFAVTFPCSALGIAPGSGVHS